MTSSRGVGASTPQRNFFPFYVNFDSYNLERYDFSRGPNSILFGNGTGAIQVSSATADGSGNIGSVANLTLVSGGSVDAQQASTTTVSYPNARRC
jgi:hypothetical protein